MTTNQTTSLPRLLDPDEASAYLGVPRRTMDRWRTLKKRPYAFHAGKRVLYPESELISWIHDELRRQNDAD